MRISVEDLAVDRGGRLVIDGLSFQAESGEALLLLGANGTGKTTLLRTLAGYVIPQRGTIHLDGGDADKTLAEHVHQIGHQNAVKASLTVLENLRFWAGFLGETAEDAAIDYALSRFGLENLADLPAGYLSAGQKRRLGLARLLIVVRPIWLLDEPTVSLDAAASGLFADAVNAHTKSGGIAIAATHLPLGLERTRELRLGAKETTS